MRTLKGGSPAAAALVLAFCLAPPGVATAMMGASLSAPFRHDIDAHCEPLDRAAERSKLIFGINVKTYPGEDETGTFAHVLVRAGKIAAVYLYSTETQAREAITTRDCYLGGRLARMRTEYLLRTGVVWTRTKYYFETGAFMIIEDAYHPLVPGDDTAPGPAPKDEPVYRTPAELPFFKAFAARHTH